MKICPYCGEDIIKELPINTDSPLTPRELETLELMKRGKNNDEIALLFRISTQTVKNHVTVILRKFGVENRTQAVIYALQKGWVRLPDIENEE